MQDVGGRCQFEYKVTRSSIGQTMSSTTNGSLRTATRLIGVMLMLGAIFLLVGPEASQRQFSDQRADSDGDGVENGEDVYPEDPELWSDADGDGYADQPGTNISDDCPSQFGRSSKYLRGCPDLDGDLIADVFDDDADGDGIANIYESMLCTTGQCYDPFDPSSVPPDLDGDSIPDRLDDDLDGDTFPNELEDKRGSDPSDPESTPLTIWGGGRYYVPGEGFTEQYKPQGIELSGSRIVSIVTGRGTIFFLSVAIPIALIIRSRRITPGLTRQILIALSEEDLQKVEEFVAILDRHGRLKESQRDVLRILIDQRKKQLQSQDKLWDDGTSEGERSLEGPTSEEE